MITFEDIKGRPLNKLLYKVMREETHELDKTSQRFCRIRIKLRDNHIKKTLARLITHDGNYLKGNERILDVARCYYETKVYNDDEWELYIIPEIQDAIRTNNSFIPWKPGYIIKNKDTGKLAIIKYDYATAFNSRNFVDLSVCELDTEGNIERSIAWVNYYDYILVDAANTKDNIEKIKTYLAGKNPPIGLSAKMLKLYY